MASPLSVLPLPASITRGLKLDELVVHRTFPLPASLTRLDHERIETPLQNFPNVPFLFLPLPASITRAELKLKFCKTCFGLAKTGQNG